MKDTSSFILILNVTKGVYSTLPIIKSPLMKKLAITKENLCTKYFPFTYEYIALNEKPPIMKENLHIFFFVIGRVECSSLEGLFAAGLLFPAKQEVIKSLYFILIFSPYFFVMAEFLSKKC